MTENYSSGNIKIREKSSMHMRHNFRFCKLFNSEFLSEKSALPTIHKITKSEDKISPFKIIKTKISNFLEKITSLANLLTSPVQSTEVSCMDC
jgi:hypothetical protein